MQDRYGRLIDYVRISITDRCNLRCVYCMPEEGVVSVPHSRILTYYEIQRLCNIFANLGVKKIKLTGGEPLVRRNVSSLIQGIYEIDGIQDVTLTTNGILLKDQAKELVDAGIRAVNISLDTMSPEKYTKITRGGDLKKVYEGIETLLQYPEVVIKLNCVPNEISDEEIVEIAALAQKYRLHVRFIELMPIGSGKELVYQETCEYNQEDRIRKLLEKAYGAITFYPESLGNGPSQYYSIPGFQGKIGFISAMSHKFCDTCNRVRLTAEGYLKTCLQYEVGVDLFPLLRGDSTDEEIQEAIIHAIEQKPKAHEFHDQKIEHGEAKSMSQIGG